MENTFLCLLLSVLVYISVPASGCTIDGLDSIVAASESINDTFRGNIWDKNTSDIAGIESTQHADGLNKGPYVAISHINSRLIISTNDAFENYEEYETAMSMVFTITFTCTGGSTRSFVFEVRIRDTNNHDPLFLPNNNYEFLIVPPIPSGFLITNCVDDIIVRDIDLTTERIDFEISGSSLFQITYQNSTNAKEFKADLRTTTVIRSIPEPIILTVTATDVDRTGDPRRTATATVKLTANTELTFPDEPIFSQPFYLATYTRENELIIRDSISLAQGFDEGVIFSFDGQYSQYFELVTNGNYVTFDMKEPVPVELYREGQILLVVKAERNYTSGATATVVVQLPEVTELAFETGVYEGSIEDDILNLGDLQLKQGYEDTIIIVDITSDYKSYFSASIDGNTITLSMDPLSDSVIRENNFINLQVTAASNLNSTATTVVTLEIIKDDITTPVFERNIYTGSYAQETGLSLEQIVLIQGYDNTVNVTLEGEHSSLFEKKQDGPQISLTMTSVPSELLAERNILVSVRATKPRTVGANTAVRIALPIARELRFEKFMYKGNFEDNIIALETIVLNVGYDSDVIFSLTGDHANFFNLNVTNNEIRLGVKEQLPETAVENSFLILVLSASGTNTVTATATIILEILKQDTVTPVFSKYIYEGNYINSSHIDFETITLIQGYGDTVNFGLDGEHAEYFSINSTENAVMLTLKSAIPEDLIFKEKVLLFSVRAEKSRTVGANAAISLKFPQDLTEPTILRFSQNTYRGLLNDSILIMDDIILESGFTTETKFLLSGDSVDNFDVSNNNNVISIELSNTAALEDLKNYKHIVLELEASRERAVSVISTLIIDIPVIQVIIPVFEKAFYIGTFTKDNGLEFTEEIALKLGFDETVTFELEGDNAQWFSVSQYGNSVSIISNVTNLLPDEVFLENDHLLFTIIAHKADTIGGRAVISISLLKDFTVTEHLAFLKDFYTGYIENNTLTLETITINKDLTNDINLTLSGDHFNYFQINQTDTYINIQLTNEIPSEIIESNNILVLALEANSVTNRAHTTIIFEIKKDSNEWIVLNFEHTYYRGSYSETGGFIFESPIRLTNGFDESVRFTLEGDHSLWFSINLNGSSITLLQSKKIPSMIMDENRNLIFTIMAQTLTNSSTRATIIIDILTGSEVDASLSFDRILYNGNLTDGVISHETIELTGFTGSNINISGELATSFEANVANGYVTVDVVQSALFPENLTYIALTLQADSAKAVLILDCIEPSGSGLPVVSFSSPSYFLWADTNQTGVVGRVKATVDNGESVLYSITVDDELQERVLINTEGEITLLASVSRGIHNFKVTATAQTSTVSATAPVLLRVDDLPECSTEDGLPPLVVLERVEEEPHLNLVVLNQTENKDCWYTMTNLWPEDQSWLYVDSRGLHAKAIDREHKSIAFMILSQIQVELILHCDNDDEKAIVKRSLAAETGSKLDPYNYGSNKWVLADTIMYNARRSVVNLIVEDINDNAPIFAGKQNEPIYVGYPIPELENTILPRALIELKATDADIGENAALMYWSMDENLAVAPTTGFVHVRNNALLEDNSQFTVYATDQNGRGLNGTLDIVVKLLERNQIAVITVKNAFLDDENSILSNLTTLVGYDVKILRTVVISNNNEETEENFRRKRETVNTFGASLQLFVYGISGNQLVNVEKLMSDLDKVVSANTVRVISLEDHLEALEICPVSGQYTALLAATIALAVILFILIVAATVWFLLKWRKTQNYEQFSDANSQNSRIEAEPIPKVESPSKPRLDIEELKRSERRLQEMLDTPIAENVVQPPKIESNQVKVDESIAKAQETLINFSVDPQQPIVIQSIDKLKDNTDDLGDDEFGEVKITTPRKSVVTFNENVEKIIHLEYGIDDNPEDLEPETEVYRL